MFFAILTEYSMDDEEWNGGSTFEGGKKVTKYFVILLIQEYQSCVSTRCSVAYIRIIPFFGNIYNANFGTLWKISCSRWFFGVRFLVFLSKKAKKYSVFLKLEVIK